MFQTALKKQLIKKASGFIIPSSTKGFTLIELLIVIAILGILATAVLSAINPIEQINRGRDTGTQSDAEQLLSAMQRFNAANGYMPYVTSADDSSQLTFSIVASASASLGTGKQTTNIWKIQSGDPASPLSPAQSPLDIIGPTSGGSSELQQSYINKITATTYNSLYVYKADGTTATSLYVCFKPQSDSFTKQAKKRCGSAPADFPSQACNSAGSTYLVCLP